MGEMRLRLPEDVGIVLRTEGGMGSVRGPLTQSDGIGVDVTRRIGPEPTVLEINAEVGAGVVQVTTARGFEGSNS
jgi:hypothetical protein